MALSLVLLFGCRSQLITPSSDSISLDQPHDDPSRDAQLTLLREAHRAFVQARYPTAVLFFRRYVESASPRAPRVAEARWWLGRAYEQTGDYQAAAAEYRTLATLDPDGNGSSALYQGHALYRLDQLRQVPGGSQVAGIHQVAVGVNPAQFPPVPDWVAWFQALLNAGVTTVLLDQATQDRGSDGSVGSMQGFIRAAHLAGLSVWGSLDPHQGRGIPLRAGWLSQSLGRKEAVIDGQDAMMAWVALPDLLDRDYQAAIEDRVTLLLRAGCDGILLRARETQGYARDFSDGSFQRFTSAFGLTMTPAQLLGELEGPEAASQEREAHYWRWVGWKARSYATMAARIRQSIRNTNPAGRLLIEVHGRTVREPLAGLEQYGEDLTDLYQRAGGELVVRAESPTGPPLLEPLAQLVGSADRLWLARSVAGLEGIAVVAWTEWLGAALQGRGSEQVLLLPQATPNLP